MLFRRSQWEDVAAGRIRVAYRRWKKPTVKEGGRLRMPLGMLAIDEVTKLPKSARITKADAVAAGFASPQELRDVLADDGELYRVRFHPIEVDERDVLRNAIASTSDDVAKLAGALAKLDGAHPWTLDMLALLDAHPATRAVQLAAQVKRETPEFKEDVRKLKALGLTESLDVGYRLSPRGRAWLARHRPLAVHREDGLPDVVVAALSRAKRVGVRAGPTHAFTDVWPIVVAQRVFVRSRERAPAGWWRSFVANAGGFIRFPSVARGKAPSIRELAVAARVVDDEKTLRAIDDEYVRKFNSKNALAVAHELCRAEARATTLELCARSA